MTFFYVLYLNLFTLKTIISSQHLLSEIFVFNLNYRYILLNLADVDKYVMIKMSM